MSLFPDRLNNYGIEHTNRRNATDGNSDCAASDFNFGFFCPLVIRQIEGMIDFPTRILLKDLALPMLVG